MSLEKSQRRPPPGNYVRRPVQKLLDLGCGDGTTGLFLAGLGYQYLGIDISEAAIERARQRAAESGVDARFEVENVLDLHTFPTTRFQIVIDCYCFNMLVLDAHREVYLRNVRRVLQGKGYFILFGARDEDAYEGPISSFDEFCRLTGTTTSGISFQKCQGNQWRDVKGRNRDTAWYSILDSEWAAVKKNMQMWLYQNPNQQLSLTELNSSKP